MNPIAWKEGEVVFLDQRKLPHCEEYIHCHTLEDCHNAIAQMVLRGAPLIGVAAMWGLAFWLKKHPRGSWQDWEAACQYLGTARPTAVNLFYAIEKCQKVVADCYREEETFSGLDGKIAGLAEEELGQTLQAHKSIATYGAAELARLYGERPLSLMTICNTGVLACGAMGTALGIISHLHSLGRVEMVYALETRPWLQGSRLTAYELSQENIPYKIVVDSASSWVMREKVPDAVLVGADRIAANGDTANKIGTSSLAILARHYNIPFYVAAPISSFDRELKSGEDICIELRGAEEVLQCQGVSLAPEGAEALNPGFDITDHRLITALFCEKGMVHPVVDDAVPLNRRGMHHLGF